MSRYQSSSSILNFSLDEMSFVYEPDSTQPILIKKPKSIADKNNNNNQVPTPGKQGRKSKGTTTSTKNDPQLAILSEEERKAELNKRSAQASRERKRELKEYLEKRSESLKQESSSLDLKIREIETENRVLTEELKQLKQMIFNVQQLVTLYSLPKTAFTQQLPSLPMSQAISGPPFLMGH